VYYKLHAEIVGRHAEKFFGVVGLCFYCDLSTIGRESDLAS
jgi:hypothetical protein